MMMTFLGICLEQLKANSADIIRCYEGASNLLITLDSSSKFNKERRDSISKFVIGEFLEENIGTIPRLLLNKWLVLRSILSLSRFNYYNVKLHKTIYSIYFSTLINQD